MFIKNPDWSKPDILIVETDEAMRHGLKLLLLKNDFKVREQPNLILGIEDIKQKRPDLLLVDFQHAEFGEHELFLLFKAEVLEKLIPVLFVKDEYEGQFEFGVHNEIIDFINRPVRIHELMFRIEKLLKISIIKAGKFALELAEVAVSPAADKKSYRWNIDGLPDKMFFSLYQAVKKLESNIVKGKLREICRLNPELADLIEFCLERYSIGALALLFEDELERRRYRFES